MDTPTKLELKDGSVLTVTWDDGVTQTLTARQLRDACSCADCRTAAEAQKPQLRLVAPMLTTIADAKLVGSYGINFTFAPDGHRTGIFSFEQLRSLGP